MSDHPATISVVGSILRSVEPARNRFRFYRMWEQANLFGGLDLLIAWGRIGKAPRERTEHFEGPAALDHRARELLARRRRHGYR